MIANFAASLLLAVTSSASALPATAAATPFPDKGDPLTTEAYTDDLIESEYVNGKMPIEAMVEIETSAGCLLEEEAAEAWRRLEKHAINDGVEFTASWCYRDLKTQRRTYRRNCPWVVIDPPVENPPAVPNGGQGDDVAAGGDDSSTVAKPVDDPAATEPPEGPDDQPVVNLVERIRLCRVPTARPGNSNHGWGRAIDITANGEVLTCESPAFAWLTENAARYGWVHPAWAACEADKEEAWHWEWGGTADRGPRLAHMGHFRA